MTAPHYIRASDGAIEHVDGTGNRAYVAPAVIEHVPLPDCESSGILTDALERIRHPAGTYRNSMIVIGRDFPLPEEPGETVTQEQVVAWFDANRDRAEREDQHRAERARFEIRRSLHQSEEPRQPTRVFPPSSMATVRKMTDVELDAQAERLNRVYRRFGVRFTREDVVRHYELKFARRFGSKRLTPLIAEIFGTPFPAPEGYQWTGISIFGRWGTNTLVPIERWNDPDWVVPPANVWPAKRARSIIDSYDAISAQAFYGDRLAERP
ncbi:MAG TPA: hypothetical protein PKB03_00060 [Baekduia sp.]|nr:hypothetical protein [Baekduia sp.]